MKKYSLVLALCCSFAVTAYADEPVRGFYTGLGIGNATLELENDDSTADFKADDTGVKVLVGYRILPWLAVEGGYADYGRPEDGLLNTKVRGDFSSFNVAAAFLWPLDNFDLFGKLGLAAWDGSLKFEGFKTREDNVDPALGIGVQYRFGQFAVRAELETVAMGIDDDGDRESDDDDWIDFASVGASWSF